MLVVVPIYTSASGAIEAQRWAALIPSRGRRTVPAARHHRAYPGISGHRPNIVRAFLGIFGHERSSYAILSVAGSRAVRFVAGSRAVRSVAAGMARRRIACRQSRRVRYRRSPDTAGGMVVTCGIARRRIACRIARRSMTFRRVRSCLSPDHVSSHPGPPRRPHVSAMLTVGPAEGPSSATPRPNSRL